MTANIRVGLAAGECVTPRERKVAAISWRPAAIAAGLVVLLAGAWWLNIPRTDTEAIGRALRNMATGGRVGSPQEERGPVVGASSAGVVLVENGGRMGIDQRRVGAGDVLGEHARLGQRALCRPGHGASDDYGDICPIRFT